MERLKRALRRALGRTAPDPREMLAEVLRAHGWAAWQRHEPVIERIPLCPAPDQRPGGSAGRARPCLVPLPCARHRVTDPSLGALLFGGTYYQETS